MTSVVQQTDIEGLFRRWDLQGVYVASGEMWSQCPFHQETRAAFSVNLDTGQWNCLACHARGSSLISLVAAMEGVKFSKAEDVLEKYGFDSVEALKTGVRDLLMKKLKFRNVNRAKHDPLRTNEWKRYDGVISEYLLRRGYTKDIIRKWHIGHDQRNGVIVIPIFEGPICRFTYTRITWKKKNRKMPSYHYPKGVDKSYYLWGMDRRPDFYSGKQIVLCEGALDALWLRQHGYNAFAILGSFMSWDQIRKIEDMDPSEIVLCFDNDKAGYDCTVTSSRMLLKAGFSKCYYLRYPRGTNDPPELSGEQLARMFTRKKSVRPLTWNMKDEGKRLTALLSA